MAARKKRSSSPKSRVIYRTASSRRRSHKNTGIDKIPAAAVTVGLAAANMNAVQTVANDLSLNGVKSAAQQAIQPDQIKKDLLYAGTGFVVGCALKRFAPRGIKKGLGQLSKKIPRVF